jgi:hypothetical protein
MAFMNPWAIAFGILAAGLPVLIHWLTRPRPVVRKLSTLRFVLQAIQQRRARYRLRDFLILAVRTAAILLLALAVARPLLGRKASTVDEETGSTTRVVVLDVSQSMAARTGGIQAFERARSLAATHLAFRPEMIADLVLAGASARPVFDRPSSNFGALRDELGKTGSRSERLHVQNALNTAARLLATGEGRPSRRRELIILSDFQRTQWASADFSGLPRDTVLKLEFTGAAQTPPNLAILRVGSTSRAEQGRALQVEVEVGNFSNANRRVEVELAFGESSLRMEGFCAAGAKTTFTTEAVPRAVGWQAGRARLVASNDALPEDDERAFVIDVRPPPVFALVTRQAAGPRPTSSYYLERALIPSEPRGDLPAPKVARFDPNDADREALGASDLIVIDHPGRIPEALLTLLSGWLRRGKSVFYVAADAADAGNLKRLADLAGSDLRLPVEFAPAPPGHVRGLRFLADYRGDAPPFAVFGDTLASVLAPLRFSGGLVTRPLPDALADDVKARYGDRNACLVISSCGGGSLAILNADLAASSLVASPVFVPLVGELTALLLGNRSIAPPVACGEPFAVALPADAGAPSGLTVVPTNPAMELSEEREGPILRASAAGLPGVTRILRGERPVFAVASVVPDEESDLTPLAPSVFQGRLAGDRQVSYRNANRIDDEDDTLWAWLVIGCLACVTSELILLRAFRV